MYLMRVIICIVCFGFLLTWILIRSLDEKPIFHWQEPDKRYIKFSTFKTLYVIAPTKWRIDYDDCTVKYDEIEWFHMASPIDWLRMKRFSRVERRKNLLKANNQDMEKYLKMWQKDIDAFKQKGI